MKGAVRNLYVHFPFCRSKCAYCALHSRPGAAASVRDEYARRVASAIASLPRGEFSTVYFGGGSPALCELKPVFAALEPFIDAETEFTVELHPLDVRAELLDELATGGTNRISMGVQSLDDSVLAAMGRGYGRDLAERAFSLVRGRFDNAGIDLIAGYPGGNLAEGVKSGRLAEWGLSHCSVYSLMLEEGTPLAAGGVSVPSDDEALDELASVSEFLAGMGLERYEISNWARPGFECRHNMSVWRGEDYYGIGEGARGRVGLKRTSGWFGGDEGVETVDPAEDVLERRIFSLRTREGLDASGNAGWIESLDVHAKAGLLVKEGTRYRLTGRGAEVCDSILLDLV